MEKLLRTYLLLVARRYAKERELALTTVARRFHSTETFFDDFEAGKVSVTLRKLDQMLAAFREQWPDGIQWPDINEYLHRKTRHKAEKHGANQELTH